METPKQTEPVNPPQSIGSLFQNAQPVTEQPTVEAAANVEVAPEEPKKKKYYSPNEVMKKKGCIGCGGMVLASLLMAALTLALALL